MIDNLIVWLANLENCVFLIIYVLVTGLQHDHFSGKYQQYLGPYAEIFVKSDNGVISTKQ